MMPRSVTIGLSDKAIRALDQIASAKREEKKTLRYGVTNVAAELIELIVERHSELLQELLGDARAGTTDPFIERGTAPTQQADSDNHSINLASRRERKAA